VGEEAVVGGDPDADLERPGRLARSHAAGRIALDDDHGRVLRERGGTDERDERARRCKAR
jgi:hypothetical protein